MIKKELQENGTLKVFSDEGKKILQIETGRVYSVAIETKQHYIYKEVE